MVCDTCDHCPGDENEKEIEDDSTQRRLEKFKKDYHKHGIGCGQEIAEVVADMHPFAVTVIPLYRSCIVVEQNGDNEEEGIAIIHTYADPHWLGEDINVETLKSDRFHKVLLVQGLREGPEITPMECEESKGKVEKIVYCRNDKKDMCQKEVIDGCDDCSSGVHVGWCEIKKKRCEHADRILQDGSWYYLNNESIGYEACDGQYCE